MNDALQRSQLLIYEAEDGAIKIDVRFDGDTVWLTQPLIATLFQTTIPNISMHLRNIFAEGELVPEATVKEFLTVRREGTSQVSSLGLALKIKTRGSSPTVKEGSSVFSSNQSPPLQSGYCPVTDF